jgi:glycogen debranching enzyme
MTDHLAAAMPGAFNSTSPSASLLGAGGTITLVDGQTFALSDPAGDMTPDLAHGLFVLDARVLSVWELRLDGNRVEPLAHHLAHPFTGRIVGRGRPREGHADADLVVVRDRQVGNGMRERIEITNHGLEPIAVRIEMRCAADFAHLFDVKERRRTRRLGRHVHEIASDALVFGHGGPDGEREVRITASGDPEMGANSFEWHRVLAPHERHEWWLEVTVSIRGEQLPPRFTSNGDSDSAALRQQASWQAITPQVTTDNRELDALIGRSAVDLGALRIFDPEHPDLPVLAAGAPWYMTVFGRDSLLTGWMALVFDPSLARGVLETLARFQGARVDDETEEEPGKILHEMRFAASEGRSLGGGDRYYGSIDATPLFVMLLGELPRWLGDDAFIDRMLPHADRALAWIEQYGDRDGDGFVEYERRSETGLVNQGWKDSWDAVRHEDGSLAPAPIALCEVQGYVYGAYRARAAIARARGDIGTADRFDRRADALRDAFDEAFWMEEHGCYALALDGEKRQVRVVSSNPGHCLWSGIARPDRARAVADRLLEPDVFSGFGIRTLSTGMAAFNPVSYHNGSVWPHDNAIAAAGLARYGLTEHAGRIIAAQLDVAEAVGDRLPELFAGFGRDQLPVPAPYPSSCSPQAWAAASPLLWLRTMLGLEPSAGVVELTPSLPPGVGRLRVERLAIAGRALTVVVDATGEGPPEVHVAGLDDTLELRLGRVGPS